MAIGAMTIGTLAKSVGVGVETIRYYERIGLIDQPPRSTGYRRYTDLHVRQLRYIRNAKALRLTLDDIAHLKTKLDMGATFCAEVRKVVAHRLSALDEQIAHMSKDREELQAFLTRCKSRPADQRCPVLADLNA